MHSISATATIVTATNKMITGLNTDQPTPSKDYTGPTKAPAKTPPTTHVSAPMKVITSTITTKETPIPFDRKFYFSTLYPVKKRMENNMKLSSI